MNETSPIKKQEQLFASVRNEKTHVQVELQLKSAILEGHYKPGDKLPTERELCELFQASRSSVREALRALENAGLVTKRTGKYGGTYVNTANTGPLISGFKDMLQLGQLSLEHIRQARLVFEPSVAYEAAKNATDEEIVRLKNLHARHKASLLEGQEENYYDQSLHIALAEITQNPVLVLIMQVFNEIHDQRIQHIAMDEDSKQLLIRQHAAIVEQIAARNPQAAAQAMRKHIDGIQRELTRLEGELAARE